MGDRFPSREAFKTGYQSLPVDERCAFLADLREARGWETSVDGTIVIATRSGTTRRLAVEMPEDSAAVDAVGLDEASVGPIADDRDFDVLDPGSLHDELRYGLDRELASELLRSHFDGTDWTAIEATAEPTGTSAAGIVERTERDTSAEGTARTNRNSDVFHGSAGPNGGVLDRLDRHPSTTFGGPDEDTNEEPTWSTNASLSLVFVAAVGLVLLLFFASSGGYGIITLPDALSDGDEAATVGPVPEDTELEPEDLDPSGVEAEADSTTGSGDTDTTGREPDGSQIPRHSLSLDDSTSIDGFASTHAAAVAEHDSLRFRVRSEGPTDADGIEPPDDLDVRIAAENRFLLEDRSDRHADGNVSVDIYADGGREYRRFSGPDGVRYNSYPIPTDPTVIEWSGQYSSGLIRTYMNASAHSLERTASGSRTTYRLFVDEPPPELLDEAVDYRASATVMGDGTVRALTVRYRHEPTGEDVWIRFRYDIGETGVESPLWYDRARERVGSGPGLGE